ncbi:MAG TPA: 50S ribosomal protein L22, partial [Flavobacteriaceae bacterium]|nr:50S ribosomal protein L22 [Flavobacteriaceae bacterium]
MGSRKRLMAEQRKEARKNQYFAKLNGCPTSPRKMRIVADLVRGMEVEKALQILKFNPK